MHFIGGLLASREYAGIGFADIKCKETGLEEFPGRFRISYKLFSARAICR